MANGPRTPGQTQPTTHGQSPLNPSPLTQSPLNRFPLNKGIGPLHQPMSPHNARHTGWNLLRHHVSLPAAVLDHDALQHNLAWMQSFIHSYGLNLAPHGKTTMAPALFHRQLQHGAWGITLATAQQCQVAHAHAVPRVLLANQLVGPANMAIVSALLRQPPFEFFCLVDSAENAHQLGQFFAHRAQRLNVLIEVGVPGGRSGLRTPGQLQDLLQVLAHWKHSLALAGVEVYEGVLHQEPEVRALLRHTADLARTLLEQESFDRSPALLSGAGSAWYDIVAEVFAEAQLTSRMQIILRPGCYLTHDIGIYHQAQQLILQRNPVARHMHSGLRPALRIWAYVQSRPEPHRAIIAMGKRDAAFDAGLPRPAIHFRDLHTGPQPAPQHWALAKMMDQHAYLDITPQDDLRVGDILAFDISHPCLTFDKWRAILVADAEYNVVDVLETFF